MSLNVLPNTTLLYFPQCSVPNCVMMREVWGHIKVCQIGTECPHPHCLSSLRILAHWKTCTAPECCVCQLVRIKAAQQLSLRRSDQSESPYGQSNAQSTFQSTQDYEKGRSTDMPTEGQNSQCQGQIQSANVGSCISHCDMKSCGTQSQSSLDNAAVAVSVQANQEQCDDVKMKHGRCECYYASSAEAPSRSLSALRPFQSPSSVSCRGTETNKSCRPLNFGSQQRQTRPRSLNLRSPSSFLPDQPQGPPVPQSCGHLRTRPSTTTQDDRMPPFPSPEEVKEAYEAIGMIPFDLICLSQNYNSSLSLQVSHALRKPLNAYCPQFLGEITSISHVKEVPLSTGRMTLLEPH